MNNPANWYSGWTSFAKMKNRDPPLVMAYSSPIKCKLTPEVRNPCPPLFDADICHCHQGTGTSVSYNTLLSNINPELDTREVERNMSSGLPRTVVIGTSHPAGSLSRQGLHLVTACAEHHAAVHVAARHCGGGTLHHGLC